MVKRFVQKMLKNNADMVQEYIKDENTIFIEYFSQGEIDKIKEFADKNIYISDKDLDDFVDFGGVYEGLKRSWIRFYILTDYMEYYVWDMHERGISLSYREFRKNLKARNRK